MSDVDLLRLRCPECAQGKCVNCTGHAWDDRTDALVACLCTDCGGLS